MLLAPALSRAASFEPADCPFALPAGQVQGETLNCGFLVVPEDRNDPDGRSIRLAVAIFENSNETSPDPIVYLSGGPGGSALEFIQYSFNQGYGRLFVTGRDIIIFDQRGIGVSQPALDCPSRDLLTRRVAGLRRNPPSLGRPLRLPHRLERGGHRGPSTCARIRTAESVGGVRTALASHWM